MPQCAAKSKRSQERCKNNCKGRVCHIHGGKTPRGEDSPHFKHGKYSKETLKRDTLLEKLANHTLEESEEALLDEAINTVAFHIRNKNESTSRWLIEMTVGKADSRIIVKLQNEEIFNVFADKMAAAGIDADLIATVIQDSVQELNGNAGSTGAEGN